MALRFVQIFIPDRHEQQVAALLEQHTVMGAWQDAAYPEKRVLHLLVEAEEAEPVMDRFEQAFGRLEGFHMVLLPVEAVLPRPVPAVAAAGQAGEVKPPGPLRVSREELYHEVSQDIGTSGAFLLLTVLSTVVAAGGLLLDDVAVIIGAMVIAPLLGPNVAFALATSLGDTALLGRALVSNLAGVATALALSLAVGLVVAVDPGIPAIAARTQMGYGHIVLALAAGSAGTLAYTRGYSGAVIGVMVAVALVPPLVAAGLLTGAGHFRAASGAFTLTLANIICVNLAGTATFVLQGVRPRKWWEARKAKQATVRALVVWTVLLLVLLLVLVLSPQ